MSDRPEVGRDPERGLPRTDEPPAAVFEASAPPAVAPVDAEGVVQTLDLTTDVPAGIEKTPKAAGDYDPRPVEDGARRTIAYLLIGLLWAIVGAILIMVAWQSVAIGDLKEFGVLLSPIVVLVSASTGFYYGTKSGGK